MNTLATLVSQQIWPQLHALTLLRPQRLILLHSNNPRHGLDPARRLRTQLTRWHRELQLPWVPSTVETHEVSDHDFAAIQKTLDHLDLGDNDALHLTGGNKLMGFAAFDWARQRRLPIYYREREQGFIRVNFPEGIPHDAFVSAPTHALDALDPSETVLCQIEEGEIERPGQLIVLSDKGARMGNREWDRRLKDPKDPCLDLVDILGDADEETKKGDRLELQTAAALLHLGIPMVTRSLRLRARGEQEGGDHMPFQEIDLLFHHQGRLWIVDCKDIHEDSQYHTGGYQHLKEDVLAARNTGGLDARILIVRRARLSSGQKRYLEDHGMGYISRHHLPQDLSKALGL